MKFKRVCAAAAVAACGLAAGCGDDEESGSGSSDSPEKVRPDRLQDRQQVQDDGAVRGQGRPRGDHLQGRCAGLGDARRTAASASRATRPREDVIKVISAEGAPDPGVAARGGRLGPSKGGETGTVTQVLEPGTYHVIDTNEPEGEDVPTFAESGAHGDHRGHRRGVRRRAAERRRRRSPPRTTASPRTRAEGRRQPSSSSTTPARSCTT